jgi:hypothetical protein
MQRLLQRALNNPKTTAVGVAKVVGAAWFMYANRASITPDHLMNPETFLPVAVLASGIGSLLAADAKDEMKASEVTPETTVVVEKAPN